MNNPVRGRNIRRHNLRLVDLNLAVVRLLNRDRIGAVQGVAHLIEAHTGREQRAGRHMAHHELGRFVLVAQQLVQFLLRRVGEGAVHRRKDRVSFSSGICDMGGNY